MIEYVKDRIGKWYIRWERHNLITKRQEFVIITAILTFGLLLTQIVPSDYRYIFVLLLSLVTYGICAFGLRTDLGGAEWFTLLIIPTLYSAAVSLFYFLLPVRWLTRIPVALLYAVGLYALLLTENIYNVAANRTIALFRAARSVGLLLGVFTYYLLVLTILSFRFNPFVISPIVGVLTFLVVTPLLWSIVLTPVIEKRIFLLSGVVVGIMFQFSWVLSFWPAPTTILALFLSTTLYSLIGMAQEYLSNKMYKKTIKEFLFVNVVVFILLLISTNWRASF